MKVVTSFVASKISVWHSLHLAKHFDETVGLVSGSIKNMLYLTQTFDVLSDSSNDSLSVSLGPRLADVDEDEGGEYATIFHTIIKTRAYNFSHAQYMKSKRKIVLFTPFLIMYVHVWSFTLFFRLNTRISSIHVHCLYGSTIKPWRRPSAWSICVLRMELHLYRTYYSGYIEW